MEIIYRAVYIKQRYTCMHCGQAFNKIMEERWTCDGIVVKTYIRNKNRCNKPVSQKKKEKLKL